MNCQGTLANTMTARSMARCACRRTRGVQVERTRRTTPSTKSFSWFGSLYELVDLAARERFEAQRQPL
jgi:hypothetical protein